MQARHSHRIGVCVYVCVCVCVCVYILSRHIAFVDMIVPQHSGQHLTVLHRERTSVVLAGGGLLW
jgi:hypothetical protein